MEKTEIISELAAMLVETEFFIKENERLSQELKKRIERINKILNHDNK